MKLKQFALTAGLLVGLFSATSQADEFAQKGREIFNKNKRAVVTVQVVVKISAPGGRSNEAKQDITGTVVDPSGLAVVALSACDPAEMYRRMSDEYKVDVEVSDIKILLDDNSELPAEIVLRDKDLDLAFIRPKTKPADPMPAVDLTASGTADVLDTVLTLNRLNKAASRAYSVSSERISAVIQKPRTFYIPDSSMSTTTLGSPAFLPDGKMLGVFVMRAVSSAGGANPANIRQNLTSIILPAQEILKASQQVPAEKADTEKKAETKTTAELSGGKK